ncbi:hypothetical protein WA158_000215 [Blastocystis sp. Blastoise]
MVRLSSILILISFIVTCYSYEISLVLPNGNGTVLLYGKREGTDLYNNEIGLNSQLTGDLVVPKDQFGCNITEHYSSDTILVLYRGSCTFYEKGVNAQNSGAKAVVLLNTIESLYNTTLKYVLNVCELDCSISHTINSTEVNDFSTGYPEYNTDNSCTSGYFGIPYLLSDTSKQTICCINDVPPLPSKGDAYISIPFYTTNLKYNEMIIDSIDSKGYISRYVTDDENASTFLFTCFITLLEMILIPIANYLSKLLKIVSYSPSSSTTTSPTSNDQILAISLSPRDILLLTHLLHTFNIMKKFLFKIPPPLPTDPEQLNAFKNEKKKITTAIHDFFVYMDLGDFINICICIIIIGGWLFSANSDAHYFFVDVMGIILLIDILMLIRVNSLKTTTILYVVFMLYDLYMVFLSPSLFNTSVMESVARGAVSDTSAAIMTTTAGERYCQVSKSISLPIALLFNKGNGYSMIGLGDLAIPGFFLAYLLQRDEQNNTYYSFIGFFGFLLGILCSSLAASSYGGQPALIYLCPLTFIPVALYALIKRDFYSLWINKQKTKAPVEIRETVVPEFA